GGGMLMLRATSLAPLRLDHQYATVNAEGEPVAARHRVRGLRLSGSMDDEADLAALDLETAVLVACLLVIGLPDFDAADQRHRQRSLVWSRYPFAPAFRRRQRDSPGGELLVGEATLCATASLDFGGREEILGYVEDGHATLSKRTAA